MPEQSPRPYALFEEQLPSIEKALERTIRRRYLSEDEADEFRSFAYEKMLVNDCAILGKFRGESRWTTFLTVVVQRLFLDFRDHRWGKWRPCAKARRRGDVGILLDRLIHRDGFQVEEAIRILQHNHRVPNSPEELRGWAADLPLRGRPTQVSEDCLRGHADGSRADEELLGTERQREIRRLSDLLETFLATLPAENRLLVKMRYQDGFRVSEIARFLGCPQKPLYRKIESSLKALRKSLAEAGCFFEDTEALFR